MNRTKLCKVLLVTVAPLAFATAADANCGYDNFTSAWVCDPLDQVVIGGSGGGGNVGTGYPGSTWGGGGSSLPGYGGYPQIVSYVQSHRQYCRPVDQTCNTWASLAGRTRAEGGYDLCTAFATPGSYGFYRCQEDLMNMHFGVSSTKPYCAQVTC